MTATCHLCIKRFKSDVKHYTPYKHILLCSACITNNETLNKFQATQKYHFNRKDYENLKYIYNGLRSEKLYLKIELDEYAKQKHGSIYNLIEYTKKLKIKLNIKNKNKEILINKRRAEIKQLFFENKLLYRETGDVYIYVFEGKLNPTNIIYNELTKYTEQAYRNSQITAFLKHNKNHNFNNFDKLRNDYVVGNINLFQFTEILKNQESNNIIEF